MPETESEEAPASVSEDCSSGAAVGWTSNAEVLVGSTPSKTPGLSVNLIWEALTDVGVTSSCWVTEAGRTSVLVSSELVIKVLSPSIDVVQ